MRFFKIPTSFNWKYTIGEVLLIFLGISLAIGFNNWNRSRQTQKNKQIAISKIKDEIEKNLAELNKANQINQKVAEAYHNYTKILNDNDGDLVMTPSAFASFRKRFPEFLQLKDSVALDEGRFNYIGDTFISISLAEISSIAWETANAIGISHEFQFDCLYGLESMYNLQRRVETEIDKAADALQEQEINKLLRILEFSRQLESQLIEDYQEMLGTLEDCR